MREIKGAVPRPPAVGAGGDADSLVDLAPAVGVRTMFRRFWPDARPFRGWLAVSLGLSVLAPGLAAAAIWVLKIGIDDVVIPRHTSKFPAVAAAFLGITILAAATAFADEYLASWIGENHPKVGVALAVGDPATLAADDLDGLVVVDPDPVRDDRAMAGEKL